MNQQLAAIAVAHARIERLETVVSELLDVINIGHSVPVEEICALSDCGNLDRGAEIAERVERAAEDLTKAAQ